LVIINSVIYEFQISDLIKRDALTKIRLGEHGSDPYFPRARASEYSTERGQAYLLSSERVQEFPCRYGRHARIANSGELATVSTFVETIPWFRFRAGVTFLPLEEGTMAIIFMQKPCDQISPEFSGALRSC
jgi:hypothetical protein